MTRKDAIKIINEYVKACNERKIFFKKIFLFGSLVRGTNHKYSDIDILLVSDQFTEDTFLNWKILVPININFLDIEPHPYPTDYFEKSDPFIEHIKKTGIEIKLD